RAHGAEAGLMAARATYLAGFAGTSTVLAEPMFGVPVFGTMAHSFIQAHESEEEAFVAFARCHPGNVVLLIDTYDTEEGARAAVRAARRLRDEGIEVRAVRIDSGDLAEHARRVRRILDDAGLEKVGIFASGNLDEDALAMLTAAGAPINGFGVGTRLDTCADAPYLESAYKLVEYGGRPVFKKSEGKAVRPGRKQVWRREQGGKFAGDVVGLFRERLEGMPLLECVMSAGRRVGRRPSLAECRQRASEQLARLPEDLRSLALRGPYRVERSPELEKLTARVGAGAG
ncbi:MAG: nicotinate phosphoribosyltransferase, partial [Deltaproteobacteria bacterium]